MLQALLAKRFKLVLHRSSKEMSGYALVAGKGGPKLRPSALTVASRDTFRFGATGLSGQGIPMYDFTRFVAGKLGLVAVDETKLVGLYDFDVKWKVEPDPSPDYDPREGLRRAVFGALQEQLGLTFAAKRISVPMLVIDRAERATAAEN
jgi:uncharacterized protein (TIGR03435 family)